MHQLEVNKAKKILVTQFICRDAAFSKRVLKLGYLLGGVDQVTPECRKMRGSMRGVFERIETVKDFKEAA